MLLSDLQRHRKYRLRVNLAFQFGFCANNQSTQMSPHMIDMHKHTHIHTPYLFPLIPFLKTFSSVSLKHYSKPSATMPSLSLHIQKYSPKCFLSSVFPDKLFFQQTSSCVF